MATKKKRALSRNGATRAKAANPQPTRLVYIHGIGWQEPEDELRTMWDLALFGRTFTSDDPVGESHMAYWADFRHPAKTTAAMGTRTAGVTDDELDLDKVLAAARLDPTDPRIQHFATSLLSHLGMRARPLGKGERTGVGKRILPLPGFMRRPLARAFLKAFIGDTAAYFFDKATRKQIRQRLEDQLPENPREEVVLVSHSMGTVIAFEVLHARAKAGKPVNVRHFVTLGSPLGITEVQDFLDCPLTVPHGVHEWTNFADPFDPFALDKGLSNDIGDSRDPSAVRIQDRVIVNERTTRGNPHSAVGYLADPKIRSSVAHAIRRDAMGKFLVARDVAAELGEHDRRQSVLIEILEPGYSAETPKTEPDGETKKRATSKTRDAKEAGRSLPARIQAAVTTIKTIVGEQAAKEARVEALRHFVAARLLPHELFEITQRHKKLLVYSVWKSSTKRKLTNYASRALQADAAWTSYAALGKDVHWAVLDTGVQADHPHFREHENIAAAWDCTVEGAPKDLLPESPKDKDGHGTHVCGILAGEETEPELGRTPHRGIAPLAKLHVYKVLDDQGNGEDAWIIKALDHIAQVNADNGTPRILGLNLSLGGPFDSTVYGCGFSPICQELRRLWRDGVLVVVASGNEGKIEVDTSNGEVELNSPMSIGDPANLEECIAVGSVHGKRPHLYGVSGFSSRGPTADGRLKPDLVAPGERIESCSSQWKPSKKNAAYREESGTSMAAPAVSGLLAAYLSVRTEFWGRPDEVKALLLRTCNDLGRDRYHQGHGMPNLMKMLLES